MTSRRRHNNGMTDAAKTTLPDELDRAARAAFYVERRIAHHARNSAVSDAFRADLARLRAMAGGAK